MNVESEASKPIIKSRLIFNLIWWVVFTVVGILYLFSPIGEKFMFVNPWQLWFAETFGPVIVVQAVLHWLVLNHFYGWKKWRNYLWILMMPILLVLSFGFILLTWYAIAISQLKPS